MFVVVENIKAGLVIDRLIEADHHLFHLLGVAAEASFRPDRQQALEGSPRLDGGEDVRAG
jgi:hypothetical protein